MSDTSVRCILVNFRSPWDMLERCLDSLYGDSENPGCMVTLVDNASGDGGIDQVRKRFPQVDIIELDANLGFAAAVNRGLAGASERYILMLNTDAVLAPEALEKMVTALAKAPGDVAGVAPKMMSSSHEGVIDAVGTVMPPTGASFNRGIGQCDLGQYDFSEEVAGVCFGAALLKRSLFEPERVGPLYEGYFLYFEDSDWCMRATSQGFRFLTVPEAIVHHMHSGVTRRESLPFKYRLIELNTLKIVVRNFGSPRLAARIVAARSARLLARTLIRRKFVAANLSTLWSLALSLPRLLKERRALARRRIVPDDRVFRLAAGEDAYFDTVEYRPHHTIDALIDTYQHLLDRGPDPRYGKLLDALYRLRREASGGLRPALDPETRSLFAAEPECVRSLLAMAVSEE